MKPRTILALAVLVIGLMLAAFFVWSPTPITTQEATTRAINAAKLNGSGPLPAVAFVDLPTNAPDETRIAELPPTLEIDEKKPLAGVEVIVLDGASRRLPKIDVRIFQRIHNATSDSTSWRTLALGKTDREGKFSSRAPAGDYVVVAESTQGKGTKELLIPQGLTHARVELQLQIGSSLAVVVRSHGEPVAEAKLTILALNPRLPAYEELHSVTGADGRARFNGLLPGNHSVSARARGFGEAVKNIHSPSTSEVLVSLEKEAALSGLVIDADDKPVAGALVQAMGVAEPSATRTSVDGFFELTVDPDTYSLSATHAGRTGALHQAIQIKPAMKLEGLVIKLGSASSIGGVVLAKASRQPVAGAEVLVTAAGQSGERGRAVTAEDGSYTVTGLPQGNFDVAATAKGFSRAEEFGIAVRAGEDFVVNFDLEGTGSIEGVVTNAAGEPMPLVSVRLLKHQDYQNAVVTDQAGHYQLPEVPAGDWISVRAMAADSLYQTAHVTLSGGKTTTVDFKFAGSATLSGRVITEDGAPVTNAWIHAVNNTGGSRFSRGGPSDVDASGRFALTLSPGEYEVSVVPIQSRLRDRAAQTVTLKDGDHQEIELVVKEPEEVVFGVVLDADGQPVAHAEVWIRAPQFQMHTYSDERGKFALEAIPTSLGDPVVLGAAKGARKSERVIQSTGDVANLQIVLHPGHAVKGEILRDDGKPTVRFTLVLKREDDDNSSLRFQGNTFFLADLNAGKLELLATTEDGLIGRTALDVTANAPGARIMVGPPCTLTGRFLSKDPEELEASRITVFPETSAPVQWQSGEGWRRFTMAAHCGEGTMLHYLEPFGTSTVRSIHLVPGHVLDVGDLTNEDTL